MTTAGYRLGRIGMAWSCFAAASAVSHTTGEPIVVHQDAHEELLHRTPTTQDLGDSSPARAPSYELLQATQETFRAVAEAMRPYLVRIETVGGTQPRALLRDPTEEEESERPRRSQRPFRDMPESGFTVADGPTTGIIYSSDGYIVTSSFNFVREPLLIVVTLADGSRLAADLIARDQVRKIALLKLDANALRAADRRLPIPVWCDPVDLRVGQRAVALGLGFGGESPSLTVGIVSALNRMAGNAVQTDAKLSPANYGGPLCDLFGRVIGICVPMAQRPGELAGVESYDSGVGFAIPKERLDRIVERLRTGESFSRGWLGIAIDPRVPNAVVVLNVAIPSPMHEAGVQPGDKIVSAAGKVIRNFGELVKAVYLIPAGEKVILRLARDSAEYEIEIALARSADLGELPDLAEPFDPSTPIPQPDDE